LEKGIAESQLGKEEEPGEPVHAIPWVISKRAQSRAIIKEDDHLGKKKKREKRLSAGGGANILSGGKKKKGRARYSSPWKGKPETCGFMKR